jgi:hypothetical protein
MSGQQDTDEPTGRKFKLVPELQEKMCEATERGWMPNSEARRPDEMSARSVLRVRRDAHRRRYVPFSESGLLRPLGCGQEWCAGNHACTSPSAPRSANPGVRTFLGAGQEKVKGGRSADILLTDCATWGRTRQ